MLPIIKITNLKDGEIVYNSYLIIHGKLLLPSKIIDNDKQVLVSTNSSQPIAWPVFKNNFKVVVELLPDNNTISLEVEGAKQELTILYSPKTNPKSVKLVYILCADGDGTFQAPDWEDCSLESALKKITLAAQLVQATLAEKLKDHGLPRISFKLENEDGKVECHTFISKLKTREMHEMSSEELWAHFAKELMSSSLNQDSDCKFLAFLSGTTYRCDSGKFPSNHAEVLANTKGHVALGGGGLALFATGCLYTWATCLQELKDRLMDGRKVDRLHFMDDSCNRGVFWACYSSGLGATFHELAHTFDLGHSKKGVMGLGFHEFRRELIETDMDNCCVCFHKTLLSPSYNLSWDFKINTPKSLPEKYSPKIKKCLTCGDGSYLLRSQALMLFYNKWLQLESSNFRIATLPSFKGQKINWTAGIKLIEIRSLDGMWLHHTEFSDQEVFELDLKLLIESMPSLNRIVVFVIMDRYGNVNKVDINTMTYSAVLT